MSDQPANIKASKILYLATFAALLGALTVGLTLGYTAPAFQDIKLNNATEIFDETNNETRKSIIGSSLALGALVGGTLTEPSNNLGRRLTLIVFGIPFAFGWLLMGIASSIGVITTGRFITGVCAGLICGVAPTYVVEIAPPKIRGLLGTCFQFMIVIGILLEALIGLGASWKVLGLLNIVPPLLMSLLMFMMPESPQWLLGKGRDNEAKQALLRLRDGDIETELNELTQSAANSKESSTGSTYSCQTLTSRSFYLPLFLSLGLMFFQQFSGINAVLFYQTDIFASAAPSIKNPLHAVIIVCLAQVIATGIASALVDHLGRKMLLIASGTGHTISLIMFGIVKNLGSDPNGGSSTLSILAVVSVVFFITAFSIGFGPIPWMMVPELCPSHYRSTIASIATAFNWLCVFFVTAFVKSVMDSIGQDYTYWLFSIICAISCLFTALFLPETKGKTSDQIQRELLGIPSNNTMISSQGSSPEHQSLKAVA